MTDLFWGVAAGCVVQILEVDLESAPTGWTETVHLEVAAVADGPTLGSPCPSIRMPMPPGASLDRVRGRVRGADGTRHRIGAERVESTSPAVDRSRDAILHLPELTTGDRAVLDLQRTLPPGPLRYVETTARYLSVTADATLQSSDDGLQRDPERGAWWGRDIRAATWSVESPTQTARSADGLAPASPRTAIEGRVELDVPTGRNPLIALYPGGGSAAFTQLFLTFPPSDIDVGWVVPAPDGARVDARLGQRSRAVVTQRDGLTRIEVPSGEAPTPVTVTWTEPDAPTFGERPGGFGPGTPGEIREWTVDGGRGTVAWDDADESWALVGIDGQPVVPDRARFVRALENRFRRASTPEPGVPGSLRGLRPSLDLAAQLPTVLWSQVGVAEWGQDAFWPRMIRKARRSGAMTPTEATLAIVLWARQFGFSATWAMVKPAPGPLAEDSATSGQVFPADYDRPIVVVFDLPETEGPRFLDPACTACGAFELPRELWGSDALGLTLSRTPPPPRGDVEVTFRNDGTWRYRFSETTALEVRRSVNRAADLAKWIGGTDAIVFGFTDVGQPLEIVVADQPGLRDPLHLDASDEPLAVVPGTRRRVMAASPLPDVDVTAGPLRFQRWTDGEHTVEELSIESGWLPADAVATIAAARAARPTPTSSSDDVPDPTRE